MSHLINNNDVATLNGMFDHLCEQGYSSQNLGMIASLWRAAKGRSPFPVPTIICLCGSTRFKNEFMSANRDETLEGKIVLSVGFFGHSEDFDMDGPIKEMLDKLHLQKIDMADEILVLNVDGYIGHSTTNEINYAIKQGKTVRFLEERL